MAFNVTIDVNSGRFVSFDIPLLWNEIIDIVSDNVYYSQYLDKVAYNERQYCMSLIFPLYITHVTGGYFNYTQHVA